MTTKPTYKELETALLNLDDAWHELFGQVCSNPVTTAFGTTVNFTKINELRGKATSTVYYARENASVAEPQGETAPVSTGIQSYLEKFDEFSFSSTFTDLLLRDLIDQEQRRQSKNYETVQSRQEIEEIVREDLNSTYSPVDLAVMIVRALSYAAKGETE